MAVPDKSSLRTKLGALDRRVPRIRQLVSKPYKPLAAARFKKTVAAQSGPLKINVGAGMTPLNGWINTDVLFPTPNYLDATRPWPVPPGSVSHIYSDNVVEHLLLPQARALMAHALVALAPGGAIRFATPDVERTARMYLDQPEMRQAHMERHRQHGFEADYPVDLLRITFTTSGHERGYLWDFDSLSTELTNAGFVSVTRCECGDSDDPVFRNLEARTGLTEVLTMLVVEARKP
jgi:predicted SAM-dependent methyltransferase